MLSFLPTRFARILRPFRQEAGFDVHAYQALIAGLDSCVMLADPDGVIRQINPAAQHPPGPSCRSG